MKQNMSAVGLLLVVCAAVGSLAARIPPSNVLAEIQSETFPAGLKHVHKPVQALHDAKRMDREDWTEKTAYATIKFTVPPSLSSDFEQAGMRLMDEVMDKEDDNNKFNIKTSALDNLFYYSYGEWETVDSLIQHLKSDHFKDFAETADDAGIVWQLTFLENLSEDIESKERGREDDRTRDEVSRERRRREEEDEDRVFILVNYFVPPGEAEDFVEKWREEAKSTIKEEGNRVQALSRNMNDNLRYYGYSSWDSMDDYFEHTESDHHNKLQDFLEDRDIVRVVQPLEPVGRKSERRRGRQN